MQVAIAQVAILLGGTYCLSGILQHVPVFAAITASVTNARPLLSAGQTVPFVLSYGPSHLEAPEPVDAETALEECVEFWGQDTRQCEPMKK